jgi:dipeptidyl aminopeptidase/acylaminoacyl peptidase
MAMNTNLLNALNQIVSKYGGVKTLPDARRVKALLADLAAAEPKPQKNALAACIEHGFVAALQNVQAEDRGAAKAKLAERLNREEGLDATLCADTLDLIEAALFGGVSPGAAPDRTAAPKKQADMPQPTSAPGTSAPKRQPASPARQDSEVWRELRTLKGYGYTSRIMSVKYSPDGRRLLSLSQDGIIRIWDAENGRELQTLKGHTEGVCSVAYSPDGCKIMGVANRRLDMFRVWDAESGGILRKFGGLDTVGRVAYSPDGRRASNYYASKLKIWDVESGRKLQTVKLEFHRYPLLVYSPDGRRLVCDFIILDAENGRVLHDIDGEVTSVAYSPDGRKLVSGAGDGTIKIWDAESGYELRTLDKGHRMNEKEYHREYIDVSFAYSPDGRRIASWSHGFIADLDRRHEINTVRIFDAETGRELLSLSGKSAEAVYSMTYSPDGRRLAITSYDNTIIKIWDAESGRELQTLKGHTGGVISVVYSPDGRRIASGSFDGTIKIWERST